MRWSCCGLGDDIAGTFTPNERKALLTGGSTEGIEVFTKDDKYVSTYTTGGSFVAPSKPGIYKMLDGGKEKYLAVQLEPSEKSVAMAPGISLAIMMSRMHNKRKGNE